jgi:hypothetical protein
VTFLVPTRPPYSETVLAEQVGADGNPGQCVVCWGEHRKTVVSPTAADAIAHRREAHPWVEPVLRAFGVELP